MPQFKKAILQKLLPHIKKILLETAHLWEERLKKVCELLQKNQSHYDWVGFYFANFDTQMLHLKAFAGTPTEHTAIPFGKGICGQVAVSNTLLVVPDVRAEGNYLSCGIDVRSEMVVPIFVNGKNIGQIDIDSHALDPFEPEDEMFLKEVCKMVADAYPNN